MKINKQEVEKAQWAYGRLGACREVGKRKTMYLGKLSQIKGILKNFMETHDLPIQGENIQKVKLSYYFIL